MIADLRQMSGAGNTFLVGSVLHAPKTEFSAAEIRRLIADHPRQDGLAIEGALVLRTVEHGAFAADYYNPDGSHGMMCGNGSRCIVRYAVDHGARPLDRCLDFTLNGAAYQADLVSEDRIAITFGAPKTEHAYPANTLSDVAIDTYYIDVNSDHVVIDGPLDAGRPVVAALRHHPAFPRGTNVNMVEVDSPSHLRLATFERGVEAITGACGTGAIATAITMWRKGLTHDQVTIRPPSGRPLEVQIHHQADRITSITLTGDATYDEPGDLRS